MHVYLYHDITAKSIIPVKESLSRQVVLMSLFDSRKGGGGHDHRERKRAEA